MNYARFKALLIDIDDTIVRLKRGVSLARSQHADHWTGSLLDVLQMAGVELAGLSPEETAARIVRTKAEVRWWQVADFLAALELDAGRFWQFAYEREILYLEPTGRDILPALKRLRDAGIALYITSNNPNSSILHKLRLAGIEDATLFVHLLGASELRAMKWEPVFWEKALAYISRDAGEVAVVGDNPRDDYEIPRQAGITHTFLIDRDRDRRSESFVALTYVRDFEEIADCLLGSETIARGPAQ